MVVIVSQEDQSQPFYDSKRNFLTREESKGESMICTESPLTQQSQ